MEEREKQEERNKRIGWLTSVGVQLILLILFYFIVAWKEPFPPIPEYGIELGFTSSAGASSSSAPQQPIENEPEETVTEVEETETEEIIEASPIVEEVVEAQEVVTQEIEDVPVVEEENIEEQKVQEEIDKPEEPKVDERAVMPSSEKETDKTKNAEGEEETPEIDERAIYGSQGENTGSNEGASLSLSGWVWDFKPKPDDKSDQTGKIEYKIVVDQDGYLVKIETITSTVSPAVERKYRQAVEKLTFSKTADYKVAPLSTGTITFIIKAK